MPSAPARLCGHPGGCGTVITKGTRCDAHQRSREKARGTRHERGYTNGWDAYSRQRRALHPVCVGYPLGVHGSTPVLAQCTDHIRSARTHPELFWEPTNHQSLCFDCNKRKAIAEEGGFGR